MQLEGLEVVSPPPPQSPGALSLEIFDILPLQNTWKMPFQNSIPQSQSQNRSTNFVFLEEKMLTGLQIDRQTSFSSKKVLIGPQIDR